MAVRLSPSVATDALYMGAISPRWLQELNGYPCCGVRRIHLALLLLSVNRFSDHPMGSMKQKLTDCYTIA